MAEKSLLLTICAVMALGVAILSLASRSVYSSNTTAKERAARTASQAREQESRAKEAAHSTPGAKAFARFFPWTRASSDGGRARLSRNHALARYFPTLLNATVTATKTDALVSDANGDNIANPGDTLKYTVTITNTGSTDATGVSFNDTPDPNTDYVAGSLTTTPLAFADAYQALGNVQITIPAPGVLANDVDPDGSGPSLTATSGATSAQGGNVSMGPGGGFTYNPPRGFEGNDSFTYTLNDGEGNTKTGTVTITVSGMIWFVNNNAGAPGDATGDGRITNPYKTLAAFNAVNNGAGNNPASNDNIFLYESPTDYVGPVSLLSGQRLIGQDSTISLSSITGLTEPTGSEPLPAMNSANATIVNITDGASGITVAQNNTIRGLNVGDTTGTDITGSSFGTLTVADVSLTGTGRALNLSTGTLAATFNSIASTNSTTTGISLASVSGSFQVSGTTTIDNAAGVGINISTVASIPVGTSIQFGTVNILNRNATGIVIDDVDNADNSLGGVVFGTTTIANPHNVGGFGVKVQNSSMNVGFAAANISGTKQTVAETDSNSDGIPESEGDGDAIFLTNNTGSFTLGGGTLQDLGDDGIDVRNSGDITLTGVTIQRPNRVINSLTPGHHGFFASELRGANKIQNSTIQEVPAGGGGIKVINVTSTGSSLTLDNSDFTQPAAMVGKTGDSFVIVQGGGSTNTSLIITNTSDFFNLDGNAVQSIAGSTAGSTATVNTTIQNSSFRNAATPSGLNAILLSASNAGTQSFTITGNTLEDIGRPGANAGLINMTTSGGSLLGTIGGAGALKNTIRNSTGRRGIHITGDATAPQTSTVDVTIDNNDIDRLAREAIFVDLRTDTGNSEIAVTNNRIGQLAGFVGSIGTGSNEAIEFRTHDTPRSVNFALSNNTITGTTGSNELIDINSETGSALNLTVLNNTLQQNGTGPVFSADTIAATASMCLDIRSNSASGGTAPQYRLANTAGTYAVEGPGVGAVTAAAIQGQNTSGTASVTGTINFNNNANCAEPVAMLKSMQRQDLAMQRNNPQQFMNTAASPLDKNRQASSDGPTTAAQRLAAMARPANSRASQPANNARRQRGESMALNHPSVRRENRQTAARTNHAPAARPLLLKPLASMSGGVNLSIGTLPAGQSITITFNVTISDPYTGGAQVSNQGTVSGSNFSDVLTDDPDFPGAADPTVTPVVVPNSAPVLADTAVSLASEAEDSGAPVGPVGTLVSSLVDLTTPAGGQDNVTDSDANPVTGMAITGANTANGNWFYSTNNGANWLALGAVSNSSARVLKADANTRLYFEPNADFNGTVSNGLTFRAWDQSNGLANGAGSANTTPNGGSTAYSAATDVASITITEVNDAPTAVNDSLSSVAEDSGTRTISFASLTGNDSKGPANESGQTLTVTAVGNAVGGTVQIVGTDVLFTPAADYNGPASFDYTVEDNGTTNGGADPKTDSGSASFTVTEVNDAPTAVNDSLSSIAEDSGTRTIPFTDLTGNDSKGPANESGQALIVKTVSNAVGGTVQIVGTDVLFTPTANYNGPASFDYTVEDNGTTNGGADPLTSAAAASVSFNVTDVNDTPTAVNDSLSSVAEDSGTRTIPFTDLTGNDSKGPANESGQSLTVKTVSNPVGGTVSILGTDVLFTPTADYNGPASFDYTVEDNGTTNGGADPKTSAAATASFTVTEVNDAPTASDDSLSSIAEDSGTRTIPFATLLGNDSKGPANESAQALTIISVGNAVGGTVMISGTDVLFNPTLNYNGPASFDYVAQDNGTTNGAADPKTDTGSVSFTITPVNDPPVADAGPDQTVGCTNVSVTLDGTASTDPDAGDTLSYVWKEGATTLGTGATLNVTLGLGVHTITLTVTDSSNASSQDTVVITVVDNSQPTITLTNQVITLWPPNHHYITVNLTSLVASASDACDSTVDLSDVVISSVTSDETENGNGDGNTLKDIVIASDCKSVQLRSERDGGGNGRVYTITFLVRDTAGNTTTATATVTVPKSRNGIAAVDSGPHYTVTSNCP
ncbi:MAG TPA: Ig-like domain-containing protein [Pyrinomonadaceae bacterium]